MYLTNWIDVTDVIDESRRKQSNVFVPLGTRSTRRLIRHFLPDVLPTLHLVTRHQHGWELKKVIKNNWQSWPGWHIYLASEQEYSATARYFHACIKSRYLYCHVPKWTLNGLAHSWQFMSPTPQTALVHFLAKWRCEWRGWRIVWQATWNLTAEKRPGSRNNVSKQRETSGWNNLSEDKRTIPGQRASYTALPDTDAQDQNCGLSNFEQFWAVGEMDGKTMKRYGIDWKTVVILQCRPNNLLHFQHWCNCTSKPTHARVSKKITSIITHH